MFNAVSSWWGAIQKKEDDEQNTSGAEDQTDVPKTTPEGKDIPKGEESGADGGGATAAPAGSTSPTTIPTPPPSGGEDSPPTESASEQELSGSDTAIPPHIPPLPAKTKKKKKLRVPSEGVGDEALLTSSDDENAEGPADAVDEKIEAAKQAIEDVSTKAVSAAKEWGSYLFSMSKFAGKTVADTAKQLKNTVEEKTILGEFTREQEKFVNENKEKGKSAEASVPPWVGYNEEESMKKQILALSADKRNFLRNPPAGVQYSFDFDSLYPVALATLQEDPELQKMRFELVPKQISEENFWRNYFYRVSLIKQSTQLTSLTQSTGSVGENQSNSSSRRSSVGSESKERSSPQNITSPPVAASAPSEKEEELPPESPPHDNEFISDAFANNPIDDEEIRKEMQQLSVQNKEASKPDAAGGGEDLPQWEKELQKELQEYEMVDDSVTADDIDLEKEILQQIEDETKSAWPRCQTTVSSVSVWM